MRPSHCRFGFMLIVVFGLAGYRWQSNRAAAQPPPEPGEAWNPQGPPPDVIRFTRWLYPDGQRQAERYFGAFELSSLEVRKGGDGEPYVDSLPVEAGFPVTFFSDMHDVYVNSGLHGARRGQIVPLINVLYRVVEL